MQDLSDWICLYRALDDSKREAHHRADLVRQAQIETIPVPIIRLDRKEMVVKQNISSYGTVITQPANWIGESDS